MKMFLRYLTIAAVILPVACFAQTITLSSTTETACGIVQYTANPPSGSIGCTSRIPVTASNGVPGVNVSYSPIYNASSAPSHPWPGDNVIEFFGLLSQYAVGHVTAFTRIDTGTKDDEGYELWNDSVLFTSVVIVNPYDNSHSYDGLFSGSCAATEHITPLQGGGRWGPRAQWANETLRCIINQ